MISGMISYTQGGFGRFGTAGRPSHGGTCPIRNCSCPRPAAFEGISRGSLEDVSSILAPTELCSATAKLRHGGLSSETSVWKMPAILRCFLLANLLAEEALLTDRKVHGTWQWCVVGTHVYPLQDSCGNSNPVAKRLSRPRLATSVCCPALNSGCAAGSRREGKSST